MFMSGGRGRDRSLERPDRRYGRSSYEDDIVRDRRYYEDDVRFERRPEPRGEPLERRVVEKERDREYYRDSSPRRPTLLRRQSSLDTYDRRPLPKFFDQREELPPPARREDIRREDIYREGYRAPAYTPIPLPKARGLPAPRRYDDRFYEDIQVEHDRIEEAIPHYPTERIVEREVIREKEKEKEKEKRSRSRESRSTKRSHRGRSRASKSSSRSSSSSSSSSSSGGTTVKSTKSEYPKKGKTRIPARLVSKRALIDIGYPFIEEVRFFFFFCIRFHTWTCQRSNHRSFHRATSLSCKKLWAKTTLITCSSSAKSTSQVSEMTHRAMLREFGIKADVDATGELEIAAARSSAGEIIRERREEFIIEAPAPPPPQTIVIPAPAPPPPPVIIEAAPRERDLALVDKTVYREISPSRSRSSRSRSHSHHHRHHSSSDYQLVERHRSRSRSGKDIRAEIRALEKELNRSKREVSDREVVRTERGPNGELVVYEESVERIQSHKGARIEKDKKGRMSISVPKYR